MPNTALFAPDWISPPGDTVVDIMEERGLSCNDLSQLLSLSQEETNQLIEGTFEICGRLAKQLSDTFGTSTDFWGSRESNFRDALRKIELQASDVEISTWLKEFPFAEMANFGWVRKTRKRTEKLAECFSFFGVDSLDDWQSRYRAVTNNVAFRTSNSFDSSSAAVAAWLRQGELLASQDSSNDWDASRFHDSLFEIRNLTRVKDPSVFIPKLQELCIQVGVSVVVMRAPKDCKASGATWLRSSGHPVMMLSGRHLSDDHFWFTFFHEAGHLILHSEKDLFLEMESSPNSKCEREANEFAKDILIPEQHRLDFKQLRKDPWHIARFAKSVGISPGIVVGQLQHQELVAKHYFSKLKRRYKWDNGFLALKS